VAIGGAAVPQCLYASRPWLPGNALIKSVNNTQKFYSDLTENTVRLRLKDQPLDAVQLNERCSCPLCLKIKHYLMKTYEGVEV
jgi:hypothetical protein